ncbi:MAG: peptidoglycan editing factor PgeF [Ghiorsea sp.]
MFSPSSLLAKHGIHAVFSDKEGGCSSDPFASLNLGLGLGDDEQCVDHNLNHLCLQAHTPIPHQAQQVHGQDILHCHGAGKQHDIEADILVANESNIALAVRTADCLPVLLADPHAGVIAAVHAGWRGTVAGVAPLAVEKMCSLGAKPERIVASLGACIASCCFVVHEDVARQLKASCGKDVTHVSDGVLYADLLQVNGLQLRDSGLLGEHIENSGFCTSCNVSPAFFSYRRDGGVTGRQLAVIRL